MVVITAAALPLVSADVTGKHVDKQGENSAQKDPAPSKHLVSSSTTSTTRTSTSIASSSKKQNSVATEAAVGKAGLCSTLTCPAEYILRAEAIDTECVATACSIDADLTTCCRKKIKGWMYVVVALAALCVLAMCCGMLGGVLSRCLRNQTRKLRGAFGSQNGNDEDDMAEDNTAEEEEEEEAEDEEVASSSASSRESSRSSSWFCFRRKSGRTGSREVAAKEATDLTAGTTEQVSARDESYKVAQGLPPLPDFDFTAVIRNSATTSIPPAAMPPVLQHPFAEHHYAAVPPMSPKKLVPLGALPGTVL